MFKRLTLLAIALIILLTSCASCVERDEAGFDVPGGTEMIADPYRIDFASFDSGLFEASFTQGNSAKAELTSEGVRFVATSQSRDPGVFWNVSSMYKAAGFQAQADGKTCVPFSPERRKVIVLKIQAEWGGAFEMFYATGDSYGAKAGYSLTAVYGGDSEFFGERTTQYVVFEAGKDTPGCEGTFNDSFRLDYTNYV